MSGLVKEGQADGLGGADKPAGAQAEGTFQNNQGQAIGLPGSL
jgi:hypothetical protein